MCASVVFSVFGLCSLGTNVIISYLAASLSISSLSLFYDLHPVIHKLNCNNISL